jgi:hypothetical protein
MYLATTIWGVLLNEALYDFIKKGVAVLGRNAASISMPRCSSAPL